MMELEEEFAPGWRFSVSKPDPDKMPIKAKGGRWSLKPNFAVPGPFANRPTSPDGRVSFHFAWTIVSRSSGGKSLVASPRGTVSETNRTPSDHDKYVTRDGAVMTIGPAQFDQYAARDGAVDLAEGAEVALLSNISLDASERADFWNAVHATARKSGSDRLILDPQRGSKKEWNVLAAAQEAPANIREIAAAFAAGSRTRKAELEMSQAEAKTTIEVICRAMPRADRKKGPVRFARARKGRTQYRLEVELPDGIDNAARVRLMTKVAKEVAATGAMYTVAVHKPDGHNDGRNYHLHLVVHDRPARLIDGQWDFTIATAVEGQSGRTRFDKRSNKVVVQHLKTASNRGDFESFLRDLRTQYAKLCNDELRAAGQTRLFDPRRYAEMGIDRKPTRPLGTRLAPLEAAGVPTAVGTANAEIIWNYELQTRLKGCAANQQERSILALERQGILDSVALSDAEEKLARAVLDRGVEAAARLDLIEPELAEYEVTLAMARARPAKTVDTCSRILAEIAAGHGSSSDRRSRCAIERRLDEAAAFLREIDRIDLANQKVIVGQQPMISDARRELAEIADYFSRLASRPQATHELASRGAASRSPIVDDVRALRADDTGTIKAGQASFGTTTPIVVPIPETTPMKEMRNAQFERDQSRVLAAVHSLQLALHEHAAEQDDRGRTAESIPGLCDLPELDLVAIGQAEMLLLGNAGRDLERERGPGHELRCARDGNREAREGVGEVALTGGQKLITAAPAPPHAPTINPGPPSTNRYGPAEQTPVPPAPARIDGVPIVEPALLPKSAGEPDLELPATPMRSMPTAHPLAPPSLDVVIARIIADRLIVLGPQHHDGEGYRVGGVSRDELRVLRNPDTADLAQAELARIERRQSDEIGRAYLAWHSSGRRREDDQLSSAGERDATGINPFGVLQAYRDHPRVARLMNWEVAEQAQATGTVQSIWRRMRNSVAGAWSNPEQASVERTAVDARQPKPEPITAPAALYQPPAPVPVPPSREAAIADYAEFIRTNPAVMLIEVDGQRRVDRKSVTDWKASAEAWEDHDLVKAAVEDRWVKEREAEEKDRHIKRNGAIERAQVVAALDAGTLFVDRYSCGLLVDGKDKHLAYLAGYWRDDQKVKDAVARNESRAAGGRSVASEGAAINTYTPGRTRYSQPAEIVKDAVDEPDSDRSIEFERRHALVELEWSQRLMAKRARQ